MMSAPGLSDNVGNLILISLVLLLAQIHQTTFATINLFGTTLNLTPTLDPQPYLWVVFEYLLYRYHMYFYDIGDKGFGNKQKERLGRLAYFYAQKRFDTDSTLRGGLHLGLLDKLRMKQAENQTQQVTHPTLEDWQFRDAGVIGRSEFRHITGAGPIHDLLRSRREQVMGSRYHGKIEVEGVVLKFWGVFTSSKILLCFLLV